jgi:long-chain fatty acid transport protein
MLFAVLIRKIMATIHNNSRKDNSKRSSLWLILHLMSTAILTMLGLTAHANVIQYFAGISYNNPSELFKVNKDLLVAGSANSYADLGFTGSVLDFNNFQYNSGISHSKTFTPLPYGRLAHRLNDKTVIGVDVTEPFNSNLNWGTDTFTRFANTQNYLTDVDVSPKIAYSLTKNCKLAEVSTLIFWP